MSVEPIAGGSVTIAGRNFFVRQLSAAAEGALGIQLRQRTKDQAGKGGYFAKCADTLQWLKDANKVGEFNLMCTRLAELEAEGALPGGESVEAFRQTAEGVTLEVFTRTRETHPEVSLPDFQAIVNETNALDIHLQMLKVLTAEGKS